MATGPKSDGQCCILGPYITLQPCVGHMLANCTSLFGPVATGPKRDVQLAKIWSTQGWKVTYEPKMHHWSVMMAKPCNGLISALSILLDTLTRNNNTYSETNLIDGSFSYVTTHSPMPRPHEYWFISIYWICRGHKYVVRHTEYNTIKQAW